MTINIADNLKRLRKQREITQEDLANFIGVSFQAVSKWERGEGYPDITILPVIANFFEVTLDELVGMGEIRNSARLDDVFIKLKENASEGKIDENVLLLREEIKHFPNNYKLLLELAHYLTYNGVDDDIKKKNNIESMQICRRILEFCTDSNIRVTAQKLICYNYFWNEDNENAAKEAQSLPGFWDCKEATISTFLNGNELVHTAQDSIAQFADAIRLQLRDLADANYTKGLHWTNSERIAILDKGNKILEIIYENGDYHFYNVYLSTTYRVMAALSLLDKNTEQTLKYLEKAVDHAVAFDTLPPQIKHTSLLVNTLEHNVINTSKNYSHSWSKETLDKLEQERYNVIRSDERFIKLVEKLKEHA